MKSSRWVGLLAVLVVVVVVGLGAPKPAEACSCAGPIGLHYPEDGLTDVPRNVRILGSIDTGTLPVLSVYYDGDPTQVVSGQIDILGAYGGGDTWAFQPDTLLDAGRDVTAVLDVYGTPVGLTFTVGNSLDTTPPSPGTFAVDATEYLFVASEGLDFCGGDIPSVGARTPHLFLDELVAAADDTTTENGLIQRMYLYDVPDSIPTSPDATGVGWRRFVSSGCYGSSGCSPAFPLSFGVGDTLCVRVDIQDAAGNRAGFMTEVCDTVELTDVEWTDGVCVLVAGPVGSDAGPGGTDSGPGPTDGGPGGTDAASDAGQINPVNDGCSCRLVPRGQAQGWLFSAVLLLLVLGAFRLCGGVARTRTRRG